MIILKMQSYPLTTKKPKPANRIVFRFARPLNFNQQHLSQLKTFPNEPPGIDVCGAVVPERKPKSQINLRYSQHCVAKMLCNVLSHLLHKLSTTPPHLVLLQLPQIYSILCLHEGKCLYVVVLIV